MIVKVHSINNVGKFTQFNNPQGISFQRYNLIYGENGQGKTTLAHILRSLATSECRYINERKAVGSIVEPTITIELDTHTANYSNQQWDSSCTDIEIFDTTYINENLFSGYYIDLDKKRKLYRFVIGDKGVKLSTQIDNLTEEIKTINISKQELETKIIATRHGNMSVDEFVGLSRLENVDTQIADITQQIATLREREQIASKGALRPISLPAFPRDTFEQLLSKQISDITAQTSQRMKTHIAQCMDNKGEAWIEQGHNYILNETCPFCGQSLTANELIQTYEVYFGEAYKALKTEISQFLQLIQTSFAYSLIQEITETIGNNNTLTEFWSDYLKDPYGKIDSSEINVAFTAIKTKAEELLVKKLNSPLEVHFLDLDVVSALDSFLLTRQKVDRYNTDNLVFNAKISELKHLTVGLDLDEALTKLTNLQNIKLRFESETSAICQQYITLSDDKRKKEHEKVLAKKDLDQFTTNVLRQFEDKLNEYFDKFMTGFRISKEKKPSYSGGKASISYSIMINNETIELGDTDTVGEPSFATSLSEGDKNTFAFAYFMSRLDLMGEVELKNKIIIIDDPISSLDKHRRSRTKEEISRIAKIAKQVIILSHDAYFLKDMWDSITRKDCGCFQISRDGSNGSMLSSWAIEKEIQSKYLANFKALDNYYTNTVPLTNGDTERRDIAARIRLLVESYYKIQYPQFYDSSKPLGTFIQAIQNASPSHPLKIMQPKLPEIRAINEYSSKYHHDENPGADIEPISDVELTSFVSRTLKLLYN